jgi:hypothetical protein
MQPQPLPAWLEQSFRWLNYPVSRYWLLAGIGLLVVAVLALLASPREAPRRWWQSSWLFGAAVIFCLAAFRWPTWFVQDEFNPDESQIIAGALTLREHPVYWRDVDAMTQGPLNAYALAAASLAGLPLNFFGARLFALLLQAGALLATRAALGRMVAERCARLGLLAPLAFWCLTSHHDFLHYSSELVSLLLLALAGWLLASALTEPGNDSRSHRRIFCAGAALGLVPFAKLQGVPPAAALGMIGLALLFRRRQSRGLSGCGWLLAGSLAVPLVVIILVMATGEAGEAWDAYIRNNLWYVKTAPASAGPLARLLDLVNAVPAFRSFWWGSLAFLGVASVPAWWRKPSAAGERPGLVIAWILLGAAIMAVLGPGRALPHYLEFLVLPLGVLVAVHLHAAAHFATTTPFRFRAAGWLGVLLLLALLPQLVARARHLHIYAGQFLFYRYDHRPSQAAYFIYAHAHAGDTLAIWGWRPQIYVETGLPQGTREAQTERQLSLDPVVQIYYLSRYLRDLRQREPAWFVDVVGASGFGYQDRARHGHDTIPELADYIRAHYQFCADIEGQRIYRRRTPEAP